MEGDSEKGALNLHAFCEAGHKQCSCKLANWLSDTQVVARSPSIVTRIYDGHTMKLHLDACWYGCLVA